MIGSLMARRLDSSAFVTEDRLLPCSALPSSACQFFAWELSNTAAFTSCSLCSCEQYHESHFNSRKHLKVFHFSSCPCCEVCLLLVFLRQGHTVQPSLAWSVQKSCLVFETESLTKQGVYRFGQATWLHSALLQRPGIQLGFPRFYHPSHSPQLPPT